MYAVSAAKFVVICMAAIENRYRHKGMANRCLSFPPLFLAPISYFIIALLFSHWYPYFSFVCLFFTHTLEIREPERRRPTLFLILFYLCHSQSAHFSHPPLFFLCRCPYSTPLPPKGSER